MPFITMTTDFGGPAAVMKGVVWRIAPNAQITDLSYTISPQSIREAAQMLDRPVFYFPDGTIHMVVVDPGVGTARRPIAARIGSQLFVGPDNGVFTPMYERAERHGWPMTVVHTNNSRYWLPDVSHIFHGRDVFSPVTGHLAAGVPLTDLGPVITDPVRINLPRPVVSPFRVTGEVSMIFDHFGNIITNIHRDDLAQLGGAPEALNVRIGSVIIRGMVNTFGERPLGTLIALIGSSGYVMLAVTNGSAAQRLRPQIGDPVTVEMFVG